MYDLFIFLFFIASSITLSPERTKRPNISGYNASDDKDVISVLVGSLLGDSHGESRHNNVRFTFKQGAINKNYLLWIHDFFAKRGLCSSLIPSIKESFSSKYNKIFYSIKFNTYTLKEFNWLYSLFYINKIKIIPANIADYLTPLAIAIWLQDDAYKLNNGILFSTYCFTFSEVHLLGKALLSLYGINYTVHTRTLQSGKVVHGLYIPQDGMNILRPLVLPHRHPDMLYKLGL